MSVQRTCVLSHSGVLASSPLWQPERDGARSSSLTHSGDAHLAATLQALLCCASQARYRASSPECCSQLREALGYKHGPRGQSRPGTSTWPLVVTWAMDTNTCLCCCTTMVPIMALQFYHAVSKFGQRFGLDKHLKTPRGPALLQAEWAGRRAPPHCVVHPQDKPV